MIWDVLMAILWPVARWAVELFPSFDPPDLTQWAGSLSPLFQWFGWANRYLLLDLLITLGLIRLTLVPAAAVARAIVYMLTKVHVLGGGSE